MGECPCCSKIEQEKCCGPLIKGDKQAPTAEALMRSRYTAYATAEVGYIQRTIHPKNRHDFDEEAARKWSEQSEWLGLEILDTSAGKDGDSEGVVEFIARYKQDEEEQEHHEVAQFSRENGKWYFVDGRVIGRDPYVRQQPKIGRNAPCPCGSGKKFKKCCGK